MPSATFYLCRHGQTELNAQGKLQGWFDTPLTPAGVANAHQVARKLGKLQPSAIYSSDLGRAFISAYIIARDLGFTGEIQRENNLREVAFGDLSGKPLGEVAEFYHHLHNAGSYTPPHGESVDDMQARVLKFLRELAATNPAGPVLVVTHDCVLNAVYAAFKGLDFGRYNIDHTNPHDNVARLRFADNGAILAYEELS